MSEIDDILAVDGEDFFAVENAMPSAQDEANASQEQSKVLKSTPPKVGDIDDPHIIAEDLHTEYKELEDKIRARYSMLPQLNYDNLYKEMSDLSIKSCPTPTLQILNVEIQKVQAAKDRLSEIFVEVIQCYTFKKRAVDILRDGWARYSDEKSADRRKADAIFKTSLFELDFAQAEALLKACTHILKNLDSLHDSLSRRITVIQLQLKLHDMGRGALPDFRFDAFQGEEGASLDDILGEKTPVDSSEGIKPPEQSF